MKQISEEVYFVASNSDSPDCIFFNKDKVMKSKYSFIDSFDVEGNKVAAYELKGNDEYELLYRNIGHIA